MPEFSGCNSEIIIKSEEIYNIAIEIAVQITLFHNGIIKYGFLEDEIIHSDINLYGSIFQTAINNFLHFSNFKTYKSLKKDANIIYSSINSLEVEEKIESFLSLSEERMVIENYDEIVEQIKALEALSANLEKFINTNE